MQKLKITWCSLLLLGKVVLNAQFQGEVIDFYTYAQTEKLYHTSVILPEEVRYSEVLPVLNTYVKSKKDIFGSIVLAHNELGDFNAVKANLEQYIYFSGVHNSLNLDLVRSSYRDSLNYVMRVKSKEYRQLFEQRYGGLSVILDTIVTRDQRYRRLVAKDKSNAAYRDSLMRLQYPLDVDNYQLLTPILDTLLENFHFIQANRSFQNQISLSVLGGHFPESACHFILQKTLHYCNTGKVNWDQCLHLYIQTLFKFPFLKENGCQYHLIHQMYFRGNNELDIPKSYLALQGICQFLVNNPHVNVSLFYFSPTLDEVQDQNLDLIIQHCTENGVEPNRIKKSNNLNPFPNKEVKFGWIVCEK
jgi:hypothetical protein